MNKFCQTTTNKFRKNNYDLKYITIIFSRAVCIINEFKNIIYYKDRKQKSKEDFSKFKN